ncbi:hypothetical protein [Baaleninema sp.]|uniref:hypothetical protein n=1 Tax=Baaleninema sp. TaxID=3101197 RepID=UPI003D04C580
MNTLNFVDVYKKSSNVWVFILLAIAIWLAHFLQIGQFGIYSDDYFRVATALGMSGDRVWPTILEEGFRQGRPLHDGLIILFSFIGGKLGGLSVIYGIGFIILMLNSCLFYTFLKRIQPRDIFALSGAFAFALFPADPTEIFLTHSLGIQTSLTLFLIAIHLYLSHQKIASYIIITLSLFTYEKLFPIFLIAPLLTKKWDVKSKKTIIKHAIVLGIILVAVVVLRKITGESRIDDLNMIHAARRSIRDVLYGPVTSMGMFVYRAIETLLLWDFRTVDFKDIPKAKYIFVTLICLCTAGFTYVLSRIKSNEFYQELNSKQTWSNPIFYLQYPRYFQDMAKLSGIGLLALVLAYPLTLTTYAYIIDGQEAGRAHAAARIGASILCACVWSAIWFVATIYRKKNDCRCGFTGLLLVTYWIWYYRPTKL